ncbi:MAG: SUMF1/EgtB/PvdO family nonheme iron enzyme [Chromatiales bacterium]|jgi:formylglycine-generating enzyme required for sulfatase activity/chromosome segregation ATPase/CRP-like cAMP-binding protein/rhodanese-related sulfurtransferase
MAVAPERNDLALLKRLVPLNTLPDKDLEQLVNEIHIKKARRGELLVREGDTDHHNVYLLSGQVGLLSGKAEVDQIAAGSDMARFPLAHQLPRKFSAKARTPVEYVRIDSRMLSERLAQSSHSAYEVEDLDAGADGDDWMSQLLQSRVFQQIPAANIQRVMMAMEEVEAKDGDEVIRQGEEGDYFYLIHRGRCLVTRDMGDGRGPVEVAQLGPGDSFGEEALLSEKPRNSNVSMLSDGILLRLSKPHFVSLVKRPLARTLKLGEAKSRIAEGAVWLDVRPQSDYEAGHLEGSVNLPFGSLRYQASSLAPDRHYVAYCKDGQVSSAAAYLLTERGFEVSVLDGGLERAGPGALATGAAVGEAPAAYEDEADSELTGELKRLRGALGESSSRVEELESRLARAEVEKKRVVDQRQQDIAALRDLIEKAKAQIQAEKGARDQALAERKKEQAHTAELRNKLREAQDQVATLTRETRAAQRSFARQSETQRAEWESRVEGLERSLSAEQVRLAQMERNRAELQARLDQVLAEHQAREADLERGRAELDEELSQAREALAEAGESRAALERKVAEQAERVSALEAEHARDSEAGDSLQSEIDRLRVALDEERAALAQARSEGEKLRGAAGELEGTRGELEAVRARESELQKRVEELQGALEAAEESRREAASLAEETAGERERTEKEVAELQAALEEAREARAAAEDRVAEAESGRDAEKEQLQDTERQLGQAQAELEQARADQAALAERVQAMESDLQAAQDARSAAEARADEAATKGSSEADRLQDDLAERTAEAERLGGELTELRSVLETVRTARADAEGRVAELEAGHRSESAELAEVRGHLQQARAERDRTSAELKQTAAELERARADASGLETRLSELDETATQAETARNEVEERARQLEERAKTGEREVAELRVQLETLQAAAGEQAEVEAEIAAHRERIRDLEQGNADLKDELQAVNEQAQELLNRLARQGGDLEKARQEVAGAEERAAEAERALGGERERVHGLQSRVGELLAQVEGAGRERDGALKRIKALEERLTSKGGDEAALAAMSGELEAVTARISELEGALAEATAERDQARRSLDEAQAGLSEHEAAQTRLAEADERAGRAEAERERLREQLDDMESQLVAHGVRVEELEELVARLEEASATASAERDSLTEENDELKGQLDALSAAAGSQAGEAAAGARLSEAEREITRLQQELDRAAQRGTSVSGEEMATLEALRQELEDARTSLKEAQIEVDDLVKQRHSLEDRVEDGNARLESLNQELSRAKVDAEEAQYQRKEAEEARAQVEEALYKLQEQVEAGRGEQPYKAGGGASGESLDAGGPRGKGSGLKPALVAGLLGLVIGGGGLAAWLGSSGQVDWRSVPGADLLAGLGSGSTPDEPSAAQPGVEQLPAPPALADAPAPGPAPPVAEVPPDRAGASASEGSDAGRPQRLIEPPAPVMVFIEGGEFTMGNDTDPLARDRQPERQVQVEDFFISENEVTFAEYDRFARATGRGVPDDNGWGRGDRPVTNVSWSDAVAYADWLSRRTGEAYRLPTEAQWEYAAAGGTRSFYWWGYQPGRGRANCFNCGSRWDSQQTAPVGSFDPNPYGLYDTAGNVAEWVRDCYHPSYQGAPVDGSAWDERGCTERVIRGGAYNKPTGNIQTSARAFQRPGLRLSWVGFRVVREAD